MMRSGKPKWPKLALMLRIAALLGLAILLWRAADGQAAIARLQAADMRWLLVAGLLLAFQTILSALRWRLTAAQMGLSISVWMAVREYYFAQVVNQSLPGGMIGDVGRAIRMRGEAGFQISAQAVIFERLAGQIGLIVLLVIGLAISLAVPDVLDWPSWMVTSVWLGLLVLAIATAVFAFSFASRRFAKSFLRAVWSRGIRIHQAVLSLGTALCNVLAFALCGVALGVELPWLAVVTLIPLILFAMVLPLSIGGWGLREGAAAALFPVIGATPAEGLATSVAFGLVFLVTVLPGMLIPLVRPNAPVRIDT